jgi:hypothetical protein
VLTEALARRGHQMTVVVAKPWSTSTVEQRTWQGVPVFEVGVGPQRPGNSRQRGAHLTSFLETWVSGNHIDLAHAQHWLSADATLAAHTFRSSSPCATTGRSASGPPCFLAPNDARAAVTGGAWFAWEGATPFFGLLRHFFHHWSEGKSVDGREACAKPRPS